MYLNANEMNQYSPDKFKFCQRAIVKIDGQVVGQCVEADDQRGFVVRYLLDQGGRLMVENDEVKAEKLVGRVEIIDPLGEYQE